MTSEVNNVWAVGQAWLADRHGMPGQIDKSLQTWRYIDSRPVDHTRGEWHWSVMPDGSVNHKDDKAGLWKCPDHNSRMCMELLRILQR